MPNWTSCQVIAYSNDKDAMSAFLDAIKSGKEEFDFNRIIPMPEVLKNTGKGTAIIDGERTDVWITDHNSVFEERKDRLPTPEELAEFERIGYANWYDWSCDNWGVKWPASDIEINGSDTYAEITFQTPWDAPIPIFNKMREMFPLVDFEFNWRHEDESIYPHSL